MAYLHQLRKTRGRSIDRASCRKLESSNQWKKTLNKFAPTPCGFVMYSAHIAGRSHSKTGWPS